MIIIWNTLLGAKFNKYFYTKKWVDVRNIAAERKLDEEIEEGYFEVDIKNNLSWFFS